MAWIFVSKKLCWYLQLFQLYQSIITHTINTFWNVFLSDAQDKMHPLRASVLLSLQNLPYSHYCQFHRVERQASRGTVVKEGSLGGVPLISDKLWPSRYTKIHSCLPLPTPICNIFSKTLKKFFYAISLCDIPRKSEKCDREKYQRCGFTHQRMNNSLWMQGLCNWGRINHNDHEAQCGSPGIFHFFKFELLCLKWKYDGLEREQVICKM